MNDAILLLPIGAIMERTGTNFIFVTGCRAFLRYGIYKLKEYFLPFNPVSYSQKPYSVPV